MKTFETVSFHIVKPCNMKCKFCYATFEDMHVVQMSQQDAFTCIDKLKQAGVQKITFAGGEPLLYKHLKSCIIHAKEIGMTTSIITNGSLLDDAWLADMMLYLDWIGVSIDSLDEATMTSIGRVSTKKIEYRKLMNNIKKYGYRLKINTVVNAYNHAEDLNTFISRVQPERWKVFQTLRVEGQNDTQFDEIKCTEEQYEDFILRHRMQPSMVAENNQAMTGSYLLIDPQGRLFENSKGEHTYSDSIISNDFDTCLQQIQLDREQFIARGGIYDW